MNLSMRQSLSLILILKLLIIAGCDKKSTPDNSVVEVHDNPSAAGSVLADFQAQLLEEAFVSASAIPVKPHIKDRSRSQMLVVETCLKLEQPDTALRYIEGIDNWRRGGGYADLAIYYARRGDSRNAEVFLAKANKIAEEGTQQETFSDGAGQEWRSDHIRAKIAQTYVVLGSQSDAEGFETGLNESETGKTAIIRAEIGEFSTFDKQVLDINELSQQKHLDTVKNAVEAYGKLFDHVYDDSSKRNQVEQKIAESSRKLPAIFSIDAYRDMAISAVEHGDPNKAIQLLDVAEQIVKNRHWDLEDLIPAVANLLKVRFQAGQIDDVRAAANALWQSYNQEGHKIVNVFRAGAIRPLAELYQDMGDSAQALVVYEKALQEGVENPNSRPRAEDLSATLCSMARYRFEPDAELWEQIHQIQQGLGQPW